MQTKNKMKLIKDMYLNINDENYDNIADLSLQICNDFIDNRYLTQEYLPTNKMACDIYDGYALNCINNVRYDYNEMNEEMNDFSYINLAVLLANVFIY